MLQLLKDELDKREVFSEDIPNFLKELSSLITNDRVPHKMKLTLAVSELILFASQFRRNILHWNKSQIPINSITFCITGSGVGKDSSINALRKAFTKAYSCLYETRKAKATTKAIEKAREKGYAKYDSPEFYNKFYSEPVPLFASPSTPEGYIAYLNEIDSDNLGAGFITSSEFGSELLISPVIASNLQLLSELYDEGKKEVKIIKDKDKQSKAIANLPVSALFVGSPDNILYDEQVKKKFKLEFSSKLARRSFFNYNKEVLRSINFPTLMHLVEHEMAQENRASQTLASLDEFFLNVAKNELTKQNAPLLVSKEARELFTIYKRYNLELEQTIKRQYPITKLVRLHMQWKALKLAGAFALIKGHDEITQEDYKQAIYFTELLAYDMQEFETELIKEPYELFVSLVQTLLEDNECFIDLHTLKKLGYIRGSNSIASKLKELCILASSYDESGIYTPLENGIKYQKIVKTNELGVSYLECSGSKQERLSKCASGFNYAKVTFSALANMLKKDYAYTPFYFEGGVRAKANISGKIKWLALDIDKSLFTDTELHSILSNYNHHIVRTSDKTNPYKFRLLVELDSYVELDDKTYKPFIKSIANFLSLDIDILPRSQIYFSYKDRDILSVTDKNPIEVKEHLINANLQKPLPLKQSCENKLDTFYYAYEAKNGEGSLCLFRAAKHAKDLGMSKDEILALMIEINNYWEFPMDEVRLENTILKQIRQWE